MPKDTGESLPSGGVKVLEPASKSPGDQLNAIIEQIMGPPAETPPEVPTATGPRTDSPFYAFQTGLGFGDLKTGPTRTQIVLAGIGILAIGYFLLKGK